MASLKGKVVIITGASSGIGRATAIHFASLGSKLVLCGRNETNLKETEKLCKGSGGVLVIVGDLTSESTLTKIVEKTVGHYKQLDVLINNAGTIKFAGIETEPIEQFDSIMATNVRSVVKLTQLAVPHLIKSKGAIVNVSSVLAHAPCPMALAYGMSKAALDQFTRSIALDLGPKQVRVNSVNPGLVVTNLFDDLMPKEKVEQLMEGAKSIYPLGRAGNPEDVAKSIAFLASADACFTTGVLLQVDGGIQLNTKCVP